MAVWRRWAGHGEGGQEILQDEALPFLTVTQADRIRLLVRQAFAEHGREVTVYGSHLEDDQGNEFGLWNVAAACHNAPGGEAAWARMVADYTKNLLDDLTRHSIDGLSPEEIHSRIYAKLFQADDIPSDKGISYASEALPGLVELLVVDFPDTVHWLTDSAVERHGGLTALREAGLANLRALPIPEPKRLESPDGGSFDVLLEDSVYTASRALVLQDLCQKLYGALDANDGVLAAVPKRNQLVLHPLAHGAAVPSIKLMAHFATLGFRDGVGPISPEVFWWHDGTWAQLTNTDQHGVTRAVANPHFARTVRRIENKE